MYHSDLVRAGDRDLACLDLIYQHMVRCRTVIVGTNSPIV